MERLSVASIQDVGHPLTVYSDHPTALTGLGCAVKDAREIFHSPTAAGLKGYLPQTYSNLFRLEGIAAGAGTWIDLDPGGWLCGHDYGHPKFPGVKQVVDERLDQVETDADGTWFFECCWSVRSTRPVTEAERGALDGCVQQLPSER